MPKITVAECKIHLQNGDTVPLSALTPAQQAACWSAMAERIGCVLQDYVHQHPEQYDLVCDLLETCADQSGNADADQSFMETIDA